MYGPTNAERKRDDAIMQIKIKISEGDVDGLDKLLRESGITLDEISPNLVIFYASSHIGMLIELMKRGVPPLASQAATNLIERMSYENIDPKNFLFSVKAQKRQLEFNYLKSFLYLMTIPDGVADYNRQLSDEQKNKIIKYLTHPKKYEFLLSALGELNKYVPLLSRSEAVPLLKYLQEIGFHDIHKLISDAIKLSSDAIKNATRVETSTATFRRREPMLNAYTTVRRYGGRRKRRRQTKRRHKK